MRKQDRIIIWPIYFDSGKSRENGRRVAKTLAVTSPKASEIKEAAEKIGLGCEIVADVGYPKTPWLKMGSILVDKKGSKNQTIGMIAKQLLKIRSASKEV